MPGKASTIYINGVKPSIGDTTTAGRLGRGGCGIFTWLACPDCGLERWVSRHAPNKLCMRCAAIRRQLVGEKNPRWQGGVRRAGGYNYITVYEDNPFIKMASKVFIHGKWRYNIAEHRLVMAQHLGRPLKKWELVHHRNGIRDDNRIENLELLAHHKQHLPSMNLQRMVIDLEKRVTLLEAENARLQFLLSGGQDSVPDTFEFKAL